MPSPTRAIFCSLLKVYFSARRVYDCAAFVVQQYLHIPQTRISIAVFFPLRCKLRKPGENFVHNFQRINSCCRLTAYTSASRHECNREGIILLLALLIVTNSWHKTNDISTWKGFHASVEIRNISLRATSCEQIHWTANM